ncbi:protein FAR1-RELATED SEQUENCE [Trifolium repens]|nr:protein FAR1-RELATED SEQUENCE [Trifolium repens]
MFVIFKTSIWDFASTYATWCSDFYKLYKLETREDFEHQWPQVVARYNLQSNNHVKGLYEIRNYWVLAYLRDYFFGGMTTTGRSKSINAFIKRFINTHTSLSDFVKQVDVAIDDIKQREEHDIVSAKCKGSNVKFMSPFQEQTHSVLTHFSFQKFQEEFERSAQYSIDHENDNVFVLRFYKDINSRKQEVFWDGWLLQVPIDDKEVKSQGNVVIEEQVIDSNNEAHSQHVNYHPNSKTKGHPKRRRPLKGGKSYHIP